jgi:hypothetical protein
MLRDRLWTNTSRPPVLTDELGVAIHVNVIICIYMYCTTFIDWLVIVNMNGAERRSAKYNRVMHVQKHYKDSTRKRLPQTLSRVPKHVHPPLHHVPSPSPH